MGAIKVPAALERPRKRLLRLAAKGGFTLTALSRQIGRDHAYLQQFIKRHVPVELAYEDRVDLARVLSCTVDDLTVDKTRLANGHTKGSVISEAVKIPVIRLITKPTKATIAVVGRSVEGTDRMTLKKDDVASRIATPPFLAGVADAYACYVPDDKMSPVLRRGYLAYMNPKLRVRAGTEAMIWLTDGTGMIRTIVERRPKEIVVASYQPAQKMVLSLKDIEALHVVVGSTRIPE